MITGLLVIGILAGPFIFRLVPPESRVKLNFINEISLAFIAFAASAELYLKEYRSRFNSIKWMTFGQLVVTFVLSSIVVYLLADQIGFMAEMDTRSKIAIAMLTGTIFVARSPASAIAVINEMRARGPFTQTVLGVTVVKDFLVIVLFALNLALAMAMINGNPIDLIFLVILIGETFTALLLGIAVGYLLRWILSYRRSSQLKSFLILLTGYGVYRFSHFVEVWSSSVMGKSIFLEELLICIIASFYITNYTRYRAEFLKILNEMGGYIYVAFFTLAGATLSLDILYQFIGVAFIFFVIRLISIVIGAYMGGTLAGDPPLFNRVGWMPYVTQAGVGLGLATIVANTFPSWGYEFSTLIISVIVINQIVGPPLFKWSLNIVKEGHSRADTPAFDGIRDALIFGFESQSIALARQLQDNGWVVRLVTFKQDVNREEYPDIDIRVIDEISLEMLEGLDARLSEAIVCMLTDEENYQISELVYEHVGTRDLVVRLNHRYNFDKFHRLGALIVDPSTAIVSLMDHFVRSPQAASLLLGMDTDQDSMDIEVQNPNLHGIPLRDLRLPSDLIILSVNRGGHQLISHGYTRLRLGDYITVVGSKESLENVALRFAVQ